MSQVMEADAMFASFDIEELEVLDVSDGVALPQMGASSADALSDAVGVQLCCSSSSSTCCCC